MYTGLIGALSLDVLDINRGGIGAPDSKIAYINGFTLDQSTQTFEVSKVGQVYKDSYPGRQSWSASATGAAVFSESGQALLYDAMRSRLKVKLYLFLDTEKRIYFSGVGYIESMSLDFSADGVANIAINIIGVKDLVLVNPTAPVENVVEELFFKFRLDENSGELLIETDDFKSYSVEEMDASGFVRINLSRTVDQPEMFFKFRIDEFGDLEEETDEINEYDFYIGDDGYLTVKVSRVNSQLKMFKEDGV